MIRKLNSSIQLGGGGGSGPPMYGGWKGTQLTVSEMPTFRLTSWQWTGK
jgi:hypothetical protein